MYDHLHRFSGEKNPSAVGASGTLVRPLLEIAKYQRGGVVVSGEPTGDRDEMIGLARQALIQFTGEHTTQRAIKEAERLISMEKAA